MLFAAASVPGTDEAIRAAAEQGYEAILVVIVLLAMLTWFAIDRVLSWKRETRITTRVTTLEGTVEHELVALVKETTKQLTLSTDTIKRAEGTTDKLSDAIDSWRRRADDSGDQLQQCLANFGKGCAERWKEMLPAELKAHLAELLPAELQKHAEPVLIKIMEQYEQRSKRAEGGD